MDNYEINILRRDGNWKKVNPTDLLSETVKPINQVKTQKGTEIEDDVFLDYLNKVNAIITKLEILENEKNELKELLKIYEEKFQKKKKKNQDNINKMTKEAEILNKTINAIKSLKNF